MIVVADTSPINYLLQIEQIDLLPTFFERVLVPEAVVAELNRPKSPQVVREWIAKPPGWLEIRRVPLNVQAVWNDIDPGESAAIQLAVDEGISRILIDDYQGRLVAEEAGLTTQGTLATLEAAARDGIIDLTSALDQLFSKNFRISRSLREHYRKIGLEISSKLDL